MRIIHTVVTHTKAHSDELFAFRLLGRFGSRHGLQLDERPGIVFVDAGSMLADGRSTDDLLTQGILYLGVGGGMFDEHGTAATAEVTGSERKQGKTCAQLVAEYLGVHKRPDIRQILTYVNEEDLEGKNKGPGSIANIILRKWEFGRKSPEKKFFDLVEIFDEWLLATYSFNFEAKTVVEEAIARGSVIELDVPGRDKPIEVIVLRNTDCPTAASRATGYNKYDLVVVRNSLGQVLLMPRRDAELDLTEVALHLRLAEAAARGRDTSGLTLSGEACPLGVWHAPRTQGGDRQFTWMVANGTRTSPGTPATLLTLPQIYTILKAHIRTQ